MDGLQDVVGGTYLPTIPGSSDGISGGYLVLWRLGGQLAWDQIQAHLHTTTICILQRHLLWLLYVSLLWLQGSRSKSAKNPEETALGLLR